MWTARRLLFKKSRERAIVYYLVCDRYRWTRSLCSMSPSLELNFRHPALSSSNLDDLSTGSTFKLYRSCATRTEDENLDRIQETRPIISELAVGLETLMSDDESSSTEKAMLVRCNGRNVSSFVKRKEIRKAYAFFENVKSDELYPDNIFISRSINYRTLVTSMKPKKLNDAKSADSNFLEDGEMKFTDDGTKTLPRRRSYIRKDNIKWQRSPWKVKQLRFTRHIMNLVKKGKVSEAREVFEHMKKGKVHPDVAVFNTLIAGYGREGDVKSSFKLFNEMKKRALIPTDHTYSSLFAACAEVGPRSSTILDKVQDELERRSVLLNNISTNALITALASCGRHDDALGIYSDMIKRNMDPDLHTFGSLLLAAANDKEGGLEVAQRMWSEMVASGINPDLHCFNVLLQCLRDSGVSHTHIETVENERSVTFSMDINFRGDDSTKLLDNPTTIKLCVTGVASFILGQGSRLKVHLGHVDGRRRNGPPLRWLEPEDIELLFVLFKEFRVRPEIRTFHLLAHLSLKPSLLIREMCKRKVLPDSRFAVAAIKMQAQLGNLNGAKYLLECANTADLNLDQAGYQAVATCCLKEKDGLKLIEEMSACNVLPNEYVFGTLIGVAARSRSYEYLTTLIKKMRHLEVVPNDTIMEILDAAAAHKPNWVNGGARDHDNFVAEYQLTTSAYRQLPAVCGVSLPWQHSAIVSDFTQNTGYQTSQEVEWIQRLLQDLEEIDG